MPDNNRIIQIPGVGVVEFPAYMPEDRVNAAAAKLYQDAQGPAKAAPALLGNDVLLDSAARLGTGLVKGVASGAVGVVDPRTYLGLAKTAAAIVAEPYRAARYGEEPHIAKDMVGGVVHGMRTPEGWGHLLGQAIGTYGAGLAVSKLLAPKALAAEQVASDNPHASALRFAQDEHIPVDAATRTDNNFVRGAQKSAENMTLSGAAIARKANARTAVALEDAGRRLAGKIAETPQTPETAGLSTQQAVTQVVKDFEADAGTHYSALRAIEADPKFVEQVHTAPRGGSLVGTTQSVGLPVEMRPLKKLMQPIYDRLAREAELVPLQGDKARALVALDRLMNGPDIESASVVDAALGDLKSMARPVKGAATRTQGQGIAASVVGPLDMAVRKAVAQGGPDATAALEAGRAATVNKYAVADALKPLMAGSGEPVHAYRLLTSPGDAAIARLRAVAEAAPMEVPKVGRAWLESALDSATAEGGFSKADKLFADWQRMGPETKRVLFGAQNTAQLNDFFLLAKKLAKNPNPSGSAFVGGTALHLFDLAYLHNLPAAAGMELSGATIAALAHSPKAMDALNNMMRLGTLSPSVAASVPQAVKQAAVLAFVKRAAEAGVDVSRVAGPAPEGQTK